jgi:hypothetical protein
MKITTTGLSLLEVRTKYPDCFYNQSWYDDEAFASDKPEAGEYDIDFTSRHPGNTATEHEEILKREKAEYPHPAVLAEALCIHFKETGERLMSNWYSRTSLKGADGNRVDVGLFGADGLGVGYYWDGGRISRLGVSASRKLDTETLDLSYTLESLSARISKLEETIKHHNLLA